MTNVLDEKEYESKVNKWFEAYCLDIINEDKFREKVKLLKGQLSKTQNKRDDGFSKETLFTLTDEHIKLLSNSYVSWIASDNNFGSACIDGNRPYGNSNITIDIHELLTGELIDEDNPEIEGEEYNVYDVLHGKIHDRYRTIHKETETALQIILHTKSFETGVYLLKGFGKIG